MLKRLFEKISVLYFYKLLSKYLKVYIRPENNFLEIDPQRDLLLKKFTNQNKYYLNFSNNKKFPDLNELTSLDEIAEKNIDYIILNGNLHYENDIQEFLELLQNKCNPQVRILLVYYNFLWKPFLKLGNNIGIRKSPLEQNWLSPTDIKTFLQLSDFELIRNEKKVLFPFKIPLLSGFFNKILANLPFFKNFNLLNLSIIRPLNDNIIYSEMSVSTVIPARNEAGNIENAIIKLPKMGPKDEIIFVEGNSSDNTWEKIQEVKEKYKQSHCIKILQQPGKGKGDAVRAGFAVAENEILMILDADLTVPPEELPKFYNAMISNKGEFINGSRLVYPMDKQAMRFFNIIGNKFFASVISIILGQGLKDTLCGTKVLTKSNYEKIVYFRSFFGNFDPFGDFDLIFGASRLGLKIIEIPIPYKERIYGDTNISRWKHGMILLRMVIFASRKFKFV